MGNSPIRHAQVNLQLSQYFKPKIKKDVPHDRIVPNTTAT